MRNIYTKWGLHKINRPGQDSVGIGQSGCLTREMALKTGNVKRHKKRCR